MRRISIGTRIQITPFQRYYRSNSELVFVGADVHWGSLWADSSFWRELVETGDFNGNGFPDYVLYNGSTRRTAIFLRGAWGPSIPSGWTLVATADFNSAPEYLVYNAATRQIATWYLNDNVFIGSAVRPNSPAGWSLVGP